MNYYHPIVAQQTINAFHQHLIDNKLVIESPSDYTAHYSIFFSQTFEINWSGGGTYMDYSMDEPEEVPGDDEPPFISLINFLKPFNINSTDDNFLKIMAQCEKDTYHSDDFYGGSTVHHSKSISVLKIIDTIDVFYTKNNPNSELLYMKELLDKYFQFINNINMSDVTFDKINLLYKLHYHSNINETNNSIISKI